MPVVLRHHAALELNVVEYRGAVTLAELKALAAFLANHSDYLQRDTMSVVLEDGDFSGVDLATLDALFSRYRTMFAPLRFEIVRRAAWVCLSATAQKHVDYWVNDRDSRESMSSAVRQFATFAEAADWLVLSADDAVLLETREGFEEFARFDLPVRPIAQATR